jgi:hypothetical protein
MESTSLSESESVLNLKALIFTAKIDFATFHTGHQIELPSFDGIVRWSRKDHYKQFTLHDPSPRDIAEISRVIGPLSLTELEVAVDIAPDDTVAVGDRLRVLQGVMIDMFARRLDPRQGRLMLPTFRAFYRPAWGAIGPFNMRLPLSTDQQLRGHKTDAVQVKSYLKQRDQGKLLPQSAWVARVEVRMVTEALAAHSLNVVSDLNGFKYRKNLMPYFRHMAGVRPLTNKLGTPMGAVLCLANDKFNKEYWDRNGAGDFLKGGRREQGEVHFHRHIPINNRLGQALHRLETRARVAQFVCKEPSLSATNERFPLGRVSADA